MSDYPASTAVPKAFRSAGDCYRKLGEYTDSIRCYRKLLDDYPDLRTAWNALLNIGRNYEDLKKSGSLQASEADAETKAAYEQLLQDYPSCPGTKYASRWLSRHNTR
jgi:TolA-binding protein